LNADKNENDDDIVQVIPTASRRLSGVHRDREIRNLTTFYNAKPGETAENAMLARVFLYDLHYDIVWFVL
jgi:hypothetical protein